MNHMAPLSIFLRQEIDRMQRVITTVRGMLSDLKLAIDGTIIMSENLRDALDNMFDARIPSTWRKVSTHSTHNVLNVYIHWGFLSKHFLLTYLIFMNILHRCHGNLPLSVSGLLICWIVTINSTVGCSRVGRVVSG